MSIWWSYVKGVIRQYPERMKKLKKRQEEMMAVRRLTGVTDQSPPVSLGAGIDREMQAVREALEETSHLEGGGARLELIRMVLLNRTKDLQGASLALHLSYRTAQRYHSDFIRLTARHLGLEREP